jgi:DNA-binding response OmpR family regulator
LNLLRESGYKLLTATNGHVGMRLLKSRGADAIVLDYHLGLLDGVLDGSVVADEIKQAAPDVPIVMLADRAKLPARALQSVDALVANSDGPHFLLATVHFILSVKPTAARQATLRARALSHLPPFGIPPIDARNSPFPPSVWRRIWSGSVQF